VILCLHDLGIRIQSARSLRQTITCPIECNSFFAGKDMSTPALREDCKIDRGVDESRVGEEGGVDDAEYLDIP
jgi:hypothetical protein